MRTWSRSPLLLIVLVLVPSLAIYAHSSGILERARELLAQQRYAELVAELRALPAEELDAAGVEARFTLLLSELRLAKLRGETEAGATAARELDALARAFPDTDWPARIVSERLRAMNFVAYPEAQSALQQALSHWEDHRDVALATGEYLALFEVLIAEDVYIPAPFARMWRNLMRVEAPRERMLELGAQLLGTASVREVGGVRMRQHGVPWQIYSRADDARALRKMVASDVLAMQPDAWLVATAELRLGELAREESRFADAVAHFERAVAAAPARDSADVLQAQNYLSELRAPHVSIQGSVLHRPGSTPQLTVAHRNLRKIRFSVRRLDPLRDAKTPAGAANRGLHERFPTASGDRVYQRDFDVAQGADYVPQQEQIELEKLGPGLYLCEATAEARDEDVPVDRASFVLQIGRLGVVAQPILQAGKPGIELWVLDMQSGTAQADVPLELRSSNDRETWRTQQLRTDAKGLARSFDLAEARWLFVLGQIGQEPILFDSSTPYWGEPSLGRDTAAHLLTDRPLYRPGERVHLSAVLRERDLAARKVTPPSRDQVELVVQGADGNEIHRESLPVDRDGFLETSFLLPDPAPLGAAQLHLSWAKDESPFAYASIQIEEVRLPEFRVRVELDDSKALVAGDSIRAHVAAEYLWGGPVQGLATVVVSRRPRWFYPMPYARGAVQSMSAQAKIAPWPPYQAAEELLRETMALDAEGRALVAFATRADGGDYEYVLECSVTDDSRREERGSASIPVGQTEFHAQISPSRWVAAPDDEIELRLRFADLSDRGVATTGTLRILRKTEKEEQLEERFVRSDAEGNSSLRYRLQAPGCYRFVLSAKDGRGNKVEAETAVWCADPKQRLVVQASGGLTLVAEQDEFGDDERAKVLLISDVPDAQVYLTRAHGAGVETNLLQLAGSVQMIEVPLDDMHRPRFHLRAMSARDYRMQTTELTVEAPLASKRLTLSARFAREDYRPGDTAQLELSALDAAGKPAQVPFTVAVIDASILAVVPRQLVDPISIFHEFWTQPAPWPLISAEQFGGYRLEEGKDEQLGMRVDTLPESMARQAGQVGRAQDAAVSYEADVTGLASAKSNAPAPNESGMAPVELRTDFRTTALWRTLVQPDRDGTVTVEVPLPESLTEWNALAVGIGRDTRAGMAEATTKTRKPLMVRLAHPRVFRERDRLLLSAIVHNESARDLSTTVRISADGLSIQGGEQSVLVPAGGERRVQWWAHLPANGAELRFERDHLTNRLSALPARCVLRVEALSSDESDGLERYVDLHPYGTPLRVTTAGRLTANGQLSYTLPAQRALHAESATLTLSPSVLSACIDALPYLASYPYGCTEQTLSRFVPAVAVRAATKALGVSSKRIDPELDAKLAQGLSRIAELQRPDGSFGWWAEGPADPYMTAYAIVALQEAREAGARVGDSLDRAREALRGLLPELEKRDDDMAYALFALSPRDEDETMRRHADRLFEGRDRLNDSARALLALTEHARQRQDRAEQLVAHLRNTATAEPKMDTLHWGKQRGWTWRWDGAVEATAFALRAYLAVEPEAPEADRAARWLVAQRNGARWNSTRDTAHAIFALVRYAQSRGELDASYELAARIGDVEVARMRVTPDDLLDAGGSFTVDPGLLRDGDNRVEFAFESGNGNCYAAMSVESFTSTLRPSPTSHQIEVRREVVRLKPAATLGGRIIHFEQAFADGDSLASGERLRVRLHLNALTDLEYIAIEDPRASGLEAVENLSGWDWNGTLGLRREQQEDRTAFFAGQVPQGEHVIEYDLRAETPGRYHAMPALAYAMYVPEISASSELFGLGVVDAPGELPAP